HVDVTPRVDSQAVRRREAAGRFGHGSAPARENPTVTIEDADPAVPRFFHRPQALRGLARVPPQLGDVGPALRVEHEVSRPLGVRPLAEILAVRAEDLDAVVLAVANEDAAVR